MIKYMGSKRRLAKHLLPIILKDREDGQWYVEPFVGGANMIENVDGNRMGADSNKYLIAMFSSLVDESFFPNRVSRNLYNFVRSNYSHLSFDKAFVGWVGIGCSYSGKWFGGFAGETATKIGTVRDYQGEAIKSILEQKNKLQGVEWIHSPYHELYIPDKSIVYCDPPYRDSTEYSASFDHDAFWEWARRMAQLKHKVFVSEYNAPDDFRAIWGKEVSSSLSANGKSGGNKKSVEKLFVYKGYQL